MVVIQRVRVRWSAEHRGAPHAAVRRGVPERHLLPALPEAPVVLHDVLAADATGYRPVVTVYDDDRAARSAGLWLEPDGENLAVDRLPGVAAFPTRHGPWRLFTLGPGQVGRYRANFRFIGCGCEPRWWYEQWTVHIAHTSTVRPDLFRHGQVRQEVDDRVHLYGGPQRRPRRR